jgi:hypothetical protein
LSAPNVTGSVTLTGTPSNAQFKIKSVTKILAERPLDGTDEAGTAWEVYSGATWDVSFPTTTGTSARISMGQTGLPKKMRLTYEVTVQDLYGTTKTVQGTYYCW